MSALVDKALKAKRESKLIDFKSVFDPESTGDWCELVKDIVAMANSGGGAIVIGLDNGGAPSKSDVKAVLDLDHAKFVDKIRKYTGYEFGELEVHEAKKQDHTVAVIEVSAVKVPMVFTEVGTYAVAAGDRSVSEVAVDPLIGSLARHSIQVAQFGDTQCLAQVISNKLCSLVHR